MSSIGFFGKLRLPAMVSKFKCRRSNPRKVKKPSFKKGLYASNCFPRYKDIQRYLSKLAWQYPSYARVETIGYSFKGRSIYMIVLAKDMNICKNSVLIDAGIHAREWIALTSALYIITYLVTHTHLLDLMDFYIIPSINPDGYEYSHTKDRLWRKNMNHNNEKNKRMWGVDLNRNFPFGYGIAGSSTCKASFMYRGCYALSEPESKSLANVMKKYKDVLKLYVSLHAYGNCIMYPWGFTKRTISDKDDLEKCGNAARCAMEVCNRRRYTVGSVADVMYMTSGSSTDFAKGYNNIKFSYTIELQRYGKSGFTPTAKKILEIGRETMEGIKAMVEYVHKYYRTNRCKIN